MKPLLFAAALALAHPLEAPVNFAGTWTLDTYLSDHPEQVAAAIRADLRIGSDASSFMATSGRRRTQPKATDKPATDDDQKRIDDRTMAVRYPAPTLSVVQNGDTVTLTDPQGQVAPQTLTRWEGPQLVSSTDLGGGRRMIATYSIVPTTQQLMIDIAVERAPNEPGPFAIKLVYDRAR